MGTSWQRDGGMWVDPDQKLDDQALSNLAERYRHAAQTEEIHPIDDPGTDHGIWMKTESTRGWGHQRRPVAWVIADWLYVATLAGALVVVALVSYGLWQWDFS
jgi:hypothetical protein